MPGFNRLKKSGYAKNVCSFNTITINILSGGGGGLAMDMVVRTIDLIYTHILY